MTRAASASWRPFGPGRPMSLTRRSTRCGRQDPERGRAVGRLRGPCSRMRLRVSTTSSRTTASSSTIKTTSLASSAIVSRGLLDRGLDRVAFMARQANLDRSPFLGSLSISTEPSGLPDRSIDHRRPSPVPLPIGLRWCRTDRKRALSRISTAFRRRCHTRRGRHTRPAAHHVTPTRLTGVRTQRLPCLSSQRRRLA